MPVFAGTYAQTPAIGALFDLNSHDAVNNDRPGKIIEKQDIAAFAQNQYGFVVFCRALPCIQQLLGRIGAYNVISIPLNTKGIPGLKGVVHRRYPDAKTQVVYRISSTLWGISLCNAETQKGHPFGWPLHLFDAWQFPTLTWGDPTLPSALRRFTSEFGMGSGGTTALKPPGKFC